jgi:intein/homing endonuclease
MQKIKYNRHIFDNIDTSDKAYWLGFILADGYLNYNKNMLRIKLNGIDEMHLLKFINFVGGDDTMLKVQYHNTTNNKLNYVSLYSKEIKEALVSLGIRQGKSEKETIPNIPESLHKDLIRGIWDGDGFIRENKTGIGLVGSYEVLSFVQQHLLKNLNIQPLKIHSHGTIFKIEYRSQKNFPQILEYLYMNSNTYLDRKYNLVQLICRG